MLSKSCILFTFITGLCYSFGLIHIPLIVILLPTIIVTVGKFLLVIIILLVAMASGKK